MLARWIATVAALLLACAQAGAHVRTESPVGVADLDDITAPLGELAQQSKTALPARANLEELASGENPPVTHCHVWQKSLAEPKSTSGATIWRWDSAPFGDTAANEQPTAGLPSFTLNLRFPGQQYDRETGTHYNYFRDYEAQTGRYVQSDSVGLLDGPGTYSYVRGRPVQAIDVFGLGMTVRDENGKLLYWDKKYPHPCPTGSSNAKGKAGEAEVAKLLVSGVGSVIPASPAGGGGRVVIPPPPGLTGNAITDNSFTDSAGLVYGVDAKCGRCAGPTNNQKQNYPNSATTPGSPTTGGMRIFRFR